MVGRCGNGARRERDECRGGDRPIVGDRPKLRKVATDGLGVRSFDAGPALGRGLAKPRELRSEEDHNCISGDPGEELPARELRPSSRHRWNERCGECRFVILEDSVEAKSDRQCAGAALSSNMRGVCAGRTQPGPAREVLPKACVLRKNPLDAGGGHR